METIFVDTSAWDAIEDSGDRHHAAALCFKEELVQQRARLYVTNFILDECYTLLLRNIGYARTVAFKRAVDLMRTGGILIMVYVTEEIEHAAWEVFERFNQETPISAGFQPSQQVWLGISVLDSRISKMET